MNSCDDVPQDDTPDALEVRLNAARDELLQHLTGTSDLNSLFASLMNAERADGDSITVAPHVSHSTHARGVIAIRTLSLFLSRAHALAEKLDRAFDLDAAQEDGRARVDKGTLSHDALEQNLARARDRGIAEVHARVRDLNHALVQDTCFDLDILAPACARARVLMTVVNRVRSNGRDVDRLLDQALDRASSMAEDLTKNLDRANHHGDTLNSLYPGQPWPSLRELGAGQVDASRADLVNAEIVCLPVLANFIWSEETLWPHHVSQESLREYSVKLQHGAHAGMYIVQGERKKENISVLQ